MFVVHGLRAYVLWPVNSKSQLGIQIEHGQILIRSFTLSPNWDAIFLVGRFGFGSNLIVPVYTFHSYVTLLSGTKLNKD